MDKETKAIEEAKSRGKIFIENGWTEIDGKHYCTDCYEYDEETDEYIPKQKEDKK